MQFVLEALESGHQQGDGPFTARASKMVSDLVGGGHVLLTPSCTHALEMASMLADIGPGDEVILPSYTFTSAATAITKFGATPVFVDIEMETKGIDVSQVQGAITTKTKAISWVNYAGIAPNIEGLQSLAKEFGLLLIEDNAHGLGGSYKGKPLGSFGDFATQSFHATKNIQCGEGGALIINNREYIHRAEIIREKGTDRSRFIRGEVQKYQWVDQGSSYLLAEVLAALLTGQLTDFNEIQRKRLEIFRFYETSFKNNDIYSNNQIPIHDFSKNIAHMFYILYPTQSDRDYALTQAIEAGVTLTSHYNNLATSIFGLKYKSRGFSYANTNSVVSRLARLPLYYDLRQVEIEKIVEVTMRTLEK